MSDLDSIPGWLTDLDEQAFRFFAGERSLGGGDLAELGVYLGRSAVVIGDYVEVGETFTVVDLFGLGTDGANLDENARSYQDVSQAAFEAHYLRFHRTLPVVVRGFSQDVVDHAAHGTHRFVHIDASHLYDHVVADIEAARVLMRPDGILAFDDFREAHTPGVAAAVWGAVATSCLRPVLVTEAKLYATWAADDGWHRRVLDWARVSGAWDVEVQSIAGRPVVRLSSRAQLHGSRLRRAARAGLPPVLQTGLRRLRDSRGR